MQGNFPANELEMEVTLLSFPERSSTSNKCDYASWAAAHAAALQDGQGPRAAGPRASWAPARGSALLLSTGKKLINPRFPQKASPLDEVKGLKGGSRKKKWNVSSPCESFQNAKRSCLQTQNSGARPLRLGLASERHAAQGGHQVPPRPGTGHPWGPRGHPP